jgi:hypothetical protein
MSKNKILIHIIKIVLAVSIAIGFCWLINFFASFFANNFLIRKNWVGWTLYEGFANSFFVFFTCLLSLYVLNSKSKKMTFGQIMYFYACFLIIDIILDLYERYERFYKSTTINGTYSYEIFKHDFLYRINIFHLTKQNFLTFMVHDFCCLLAIAIILIVSMAVKNRIEKSTIV